MLDHDHEPQYPRWLQVAIIIIALLMVIGGALYEKFGHQ